MTLNVNDIISLIGQIIQAALYVIIAAAVLKQFGVKLPVTIPNPEPLAYLAGAFWLARKA